MEKIRDLLVGYVSSKAADELFGNDVMKYLDKNPCIKRFLCIIVLLYAMFCYSNILGNILSSFKDIWRFSSARGIQQTLSSETSKYRLKITVKNSCTQEIHIDSGPEKEVSIILTGSDSGRVSPQSNISVITLDVISAVKPQ